MDFESDNSKRKHRKIEITQTKINHGQWHPYDDYLLINSVLHLMSTNGVYCGVKFSKSYQEKDIEKRWKELLLNEIRSQVALEAIRKISLYDKDILDCRIPFNESEFTKLNKITFGEVYLKQNGVYSSNASMAPFHVLLEEDRYSTFYRGRKIEQLFKAWTIQRKHLNDSVKLGGNPIKFEDVDLLIRKSPDVPVSIYNNDYGTDYKSFQRMFSQKMYKTMVLPEPVPTTSTLGKIVVPSRPLSTRSTSTEGTIDYQLVNEITQSDKEYRRKLHKQLRMVGEEARRWTCIVEAVTEKPIIDRQGKNALATLTGTRSRFLIKEKEATFGRKSSILRPDIDLSCEGTVFRVSRIQGCIRLTDTGHFVIVNWGKQPIYVDGAVVLTKEELLLLNDSMITISGLTFRFNDHRISTIEEGVITADEGVLPAVYQPEAGSTNNLSTTQVIANNNNRVSVDQTRRKQILK